MEWHILLVIICAILASFKPKIKGYIGERSVASRLYRLPQNEYKVINNVMVRTEYGTTQIDHIVVSIYGIFVIETKNYKGIITGGEHSENWVKNVYGNKYTFRNPLKQNYAHTKALEKTLCLSKDKFIPIVAFSDECDLHINVSTPVIYASNIKQVIQQYKHIQFNPASLDQLVYQIERANITSRETKKEHISQIKNKVIINEYKKSDGICPKCGGMLVGRNGKYGKFVGCSNYPKCRYTDDIVK